MNDPMLDVLADGDAARRGRGILILLLGRDREFRYERLF